MSLLSEVKQWESKWFRVGVAGLERMVVFLRSHSYRFLSSLSTPFTIVIFTESAIEPYRYRIRRGILALLLIAPVFLALCSLWLSNGAKKASDSLQTETKRSTSARGELDSIRDAVHELQQDVPAFISALEDISDVLSRNGRASIGEFLIPKLNFMFGDRSISVNREIDSIMGLRQALEQGASLLEVSGSIISARRVMMKDLPSMWPIKGDIGYITTYFGSSTNPFTGLPYLHKGLDVSNARQGDPVIATANGKVVAAGYDQSYGNMVIIQHKSGYYTRYGHMQSLSVRKGQAVKQGAVIGKVGNTGLSTGPHVHYEVLLAGQLADPLEYIDNPIDRPKVPQSGISGE